MSVPNVMEIINSDDSFGANLWVILQERRGITKVLSGRPLVTMNACMKSHGWLDLIGFSRTC